MPIVKKNGDIIKSRSNATIKIADKHFLKIYLPSINLSKKYLNSIEDFTKILLECIEINDIYYDFEKAKLL